MGFGTLDEALGNKSWIERAAERGDAVLRLRLWPFWMNEAGRILAAHGYRLRHLASDQDGDHGNDLIYETVWERDADA